MNSVVVSNATSFKERLKPVGDAGYVKKNVKIMFYKFHKSIKKFLKNNNTSRVSNTSPNT